MTQQAQNSLALYHGGNPSTIEQLLRMQRSSVVDELHEHFHTNGNIHELAVRLSIGG